LCFLSTISRTTFAPPLFKKVKKGAVEHSAQRPKKVLFGQKCTFETVAMTAHFPTLCHEKVYFLVKSTLFNKKCTAKRSTSFGKKSTIFGQKIKDDQCKGQIKSAKSAFLHFLHF